MRGGEGTAGGRASTHHQEKQLCIHFGAESCNTLHLSPPKRGSFLLALRAALRAVSAQPSRRFGAGASRRPAPDAALRAEDPTGTILSFTPRWAWQLG